MRGVKKSESKTNAPVEETTPMSVPIVGTTPERVPDVDAANLFAAIERAAPRAEWAGGQAAPRPVTALSRYTR